MRKIFDYRAIFITIGILIVLTGCSGESETARTVEETTEAITESTMETEGTVTELATVKDTIEYNLNLAMERLRLGDKSGLYENEFDYMFKETNFDDYLLLRWAKFAKADSVKYLEITHMAMYDHDSVDLDVIVHFEGPTGSKSEYKDQITAHYHNGRWIKPTASNLKGQLEYEASGK